MSLTKVKKKTIKTSKTKSKSWLRKNFGRIILVGFIGFALAIIFTILIGMANTEVKTNPYSMTDVRISDTTNIMKVSEPAIYDQYYAGATDQRSTGRTTTTGEKSKIAQFSKEQLTNVIKELYGNESYINTTATSWRPFVTQRIGANKEEWLAFIVIRSYQYEKLLKLQYTEKIFSSEVKAGLQFTWSITKLKKDYPNTFAFKEPSAKIKGSTAVASVKAPADADADAAMKLNISEKELRRNQAFAKNRYLDKQIKNTSADLKFVTAPEATKEQATKAMEIARSFKVGEKRHFKDMELYINVARELVALENGYESWRDFEKTNKQAARKKVSKKADAFTNGGTYLTREAASAASL